MKRSPSRPVYVIPNLLTSAALFSGLCSLIMASHGEYIRACYLILLAAVLDGLDGPVARWTRTSSSFGLQFDSLADVVSFGVAPAFLMYTKLHAIDEAISLPNWAPRMAIGVSTLYAITGAIRLARFNVQVEDEEKTHFTGLPIPAAAGTVISTFLVIEVYQLPDRASLHRAIMVLMVVLSYLMVSTIPFPSLKGIHRRTRRSFRMLVTVVFAIWLMIMFHQHIPAFAFLGFLGYLIYSLTTAIRTKRRLASFSPGEILTPVPLDGKDEDQK
ncbi:CDP-diacylglycerol--serine O-phosphatidyltransferase [bacterium]|nr:CDP-diacylglycerol--serine O-phosphatidyltransferase [bacterium]